MQDYESLNFNKLISTQEIERKEDSLSLVGKVN
ncbi:MAG: hypothetical protein KatS3mg035_0552 [Bacteroidia bacterium]|nr:MAG: hypothetical protein KatS3mg035_0552 [Bacteroidia bacterium]